jgi:hypothetical protein
MVINGQTITGIRENKLATSELSIYPNPAAHQLNIIVKSGIQGTAVINILDISGRTIFTDQTSVQTATPVSLDISNLKPGIYYLQIRGSKGQFSAIRFVKN